MNNKNIYKFKQCSTLFGKDIDNRRVLIKEHTTETQPSIYLAFEPIYIIEFGSIQYSTVLDNGMPLVEGACCIRYNNKITLNIYKYNINSGVNM